MKATRIAITNGTIYTPLQIIPDGVMIIEGSTIAALGPRAAVTVAANIETIDAGEQLICPGFIDIHVHGGGGSDTMDGTYEAIDQITRAHVRFGTTALCPTTVTASENDLCQALTTVAQAIERGTGGSRVLGAHIEGPFISRNKKGAHLADYIVPPTIGLLNKFVTAANNHVSILTIAPELPGALGVIRQARAYGIICSIGHTDATLEEACAGISAGATNITHIYNAMTPLAHRAPGVVGAAFTSDKEVYVEVIADGKHVHPAAIDAAVRAKGIQNVLIMTDCMRPAGVPEVTTFSVSGAIAYVRDGSCYNASGALCGTLLTMNQAVKNMHRLVGVSLHNAINMASLSPARSLGIDRHKGSLEVGKDADVVICDDDMNVHHVLVEGQSRYSSL